MERLYTCREAARILQVHPRTLLDRIRRGEVPHVRLGARSVRLRESDLAAYVEQHAVARGAAS